MSVFRLNEYGWLKDLVPHHAAISQENIPARRTAFQRWLFEAFLDRHPIRHPRKADHTAHELQEDSLTLYGDDYWRMQEQLRNKLNGLAREIRNTIKAKIPKPVSPLEINDSAQVIRDRLNGQGIADPAWPEACRASPVLEHLTRRAGTRLQTYSGGDFAACTNDDRDQALADLPGDLSELVQVLYGHTGAELYIIASWRDSNNVQKWTDAISSNSEQFVGTPGHLATRMNFVQHQLDFNSIRYGPRIEQAGPAVIWACDGSLKPWLPKVSSSIGYLRSLLQEYFTLYYAWQGGRGELDYTTKLLVLPQCLPRGVNFCPVNEWSDETATRVYDHILAGQSNSLPAGRSFQYSNLGLGLTQQGVCKNMHSDSDLRFPPSSRYYVTRLEHADDTDHLVQIERQAMLPTIDEDDIYQAFLGEELNDIGRCIGNYTALLNLIHAANALEEVGSIHAREGLWPHIQNDCIWLRGIPVSSENCLRALKGPWIDFAFFEPLQSEKADRDLFRFSTFIRSGAFTHPLTQTIMGGPWGIRWPITVLFMFWFSLASLHEGREMPYKVEVPIDTQGALGYVHRDIVWLTEQINNSVKRLQLIRDWATEEPSAPAIQIQQATLHQVPIITPSTNLTVSSPVLEEEEDSQPQTAPMARINSSRPKQKGPLNSSKDVSPKTGELRLSLPVTGASVDQDGSSPKTETSGNRPEFPEMDVDEAPSEYHTESFEEYDHEDDTFANIMERVGTSRGSGSPEALHKLRGKRARFRSPS